MSFTKLSEIVEQSEMLETPFWQIVMLDDMQERDVSEKDSFSEMRAMYREMKNADRNYDGSLRSISGMAGGDGEKLEEFRKKKNGLLGDFLTNVMAKAVKMG